MVEKNKKEENQNEYAEDVKGESIYILNAESGQKGYFCIGCKGQMQAVRSKIFGRKQYFRHVAKDVKQEERKCTFSNQDYRHSQAIFILNKIKKIKVPSLYKYAPLNSNGKHIKLQDSKFIEAAYTKAELTFYEDDNGEVYYGKNTDIKSKNLLIRPDVTFFDSSNKPILLIEIVVTHKPDEEKTTKIRRLAIDTVQIKIPKDSLENIENNFYTTNNIKWVYNNEQERTEYIYSASDDSERLSQIDELQRKFFEESFKCRQSEINNLIRKIKRYLESQQYRESERNFRLEIQRVEDNTRKAENKLEKNRREIREGIERKHQARRDFIESERKRLERDEIELKENFTAQEIEIELNHDREKHSIEKRYSELEGRYLKRRKDIKEEQYSITKTLGQIEDFESTERDNIEEKNRIESEIESITDRINDNIKFRENLPKEFEEYGNKEQEEFRNSRERIEERKGELPNIFEEKRRELDDKFRGIRDKRIKQIKEGNINESTDFARRIQEIFDTRSLLSNWNETQTNFERNKKALEYFRKGTYKSWYKS